MYSMSECSCGGTTEAVPSVHSVGNSARGVAFFEALSQRFPRLSLFTGAEENDPNLSVTPDDDCDVEDGNHCGGGDDYFDGGDVYLYN